MWHSQETAHDWPHTDSNGVLAWYWESVNPTLTFPTQLNAAERSAAVPWDSSRLQAEEDVKLEPNPIFFTSLQALVFFASPSTPLTKRNAGDMGSVGSGYSITIDMMWVPAYR